jgi:predicted DNA-binding protein (MmcQ/YjbR family)
MVTIAAAKKAALSFPEATEHPHFENIAFKVKGKIFATLNSKENRVCIKLSAIDQSVFTSFDTTIIFPVPNKWGKQGWTLLNLKKVKKELFMDALTTAYCQVAPPKLATKYLDSSV